MKSWALADGENVYEFFAHFNVQEIDPRAKAVKCFEGVEKGSRHWPSVYAVISG